MCIAPRKYVEKMIKAFEQMFHHKPKTTFLLPLEKGDHPKRDTSELLAPDDIQKYQLLIGTIEWAVSLGRIDIATAVMTLSGFRAAPGQGHLERVKRVYGYLSRFLNAMIHI